MIELRPTAVIDLSVTYARLMGGNKIRHYRVSAISMLMNKFTGETTESLVTRHIREVENSSEEITFLPQKTGTPFFRVDPKADNVLQVKDITHVILKNYPEIEESLSQRSIKSQIYQYNDDPSPLKTLLLSPITRLLNKPIFKINSLLRRFQTRNIDFSDMDRFEYLDEVKKIYQIPLLPEYGYVRRVTLAKYLSVAFEEGDIERATEALVTDLKTLNDQGLIMGNLCMPSMILLADVTGSGKSVCAMLCFVFVDDKKILKLLNKDSFLGLPNKYLDLVGVKTEALEGGINYLDNISPSSKYDIEIVDVIIGTPEHGRQAHIDNYNETLGQVNKVAKEAKKVLEEVTVSNKTSQVGFNGLQVDADLTDKNGKTTSLGKLYRRNSDK